MVELTDSFRLLIGIFTHLDQRLQTILRSKEYSQFYYIQKRPKDG